MAKSRQVLGAVKTSRKTFGEAPYGRADSKKPGSTNDPGLSINRR